MRRVGWVLAVGLGLLGGPVLAQEKGEDHRHESVKMEDLPAAVQETFRAEAQGGRVEELRKETTREGKVVYEGEIVRNGKGTELEVGADGKVIERGKPHDESKEHEEGEPTK
jgi:hypothetical protein